MDDDVGDELLGLIFTACHPVLSAEARAALTLRLIGGLTTDEIARAFLSNEATIAQRIVRAKKTLGNAGLTFEVPRGKEREERLASVLEVIYLIFNEGYAATAGEDLIRPALCAEAQRLGRILAGLAPDEPEVFGLLALMEIQASRLAARTAPDGSLVPLTEQNRARWDQLLIRRGLAALERAEALGGADGPYALQAALAACHARARKAEDTDWKRIAALYDTLREVMPSPVVDLNRAVAHSMAFGPEAGLTLVDEIARRRGLAQLCAAAGGQGGFPVPGRPARRSQGPVRARRRTHPQRAREGLPARPGSGLRRLNLPAIALLVATLCHNCQLENHDRRTRASNGRIRTTRGLEHRKEPFPSLVVERVSISVPERRTARACTGISTPGSAGNLGDSSIAGSGICERHAARIRAKTRVFTLFLSTKFAGEWNRSVVSLELRLNTSLVG